MYNTLLVQFFFKVIAFTKTSKITFVFSYPGKFQKVFKSKQMFEMLKNTIFRRILVDKPF